MGRDAGRPPVAGRVPLDALLRHVGRAVVHLPERHEHLERPEHPSARRARGRHLPQRAARHAGGDAAAHSGRSAQPHVRRRAAPAGLPAVWRPSLH